MAAAYLPDIPVDPIPSPVRGHRNNSVLSFRQETQVVASVAPKRLPTGRSVHAPTRNGTLESLDYIWAAGPLPGIEHSTSTESDSDMRSSDESSDADSSSDGRNSEGSTDPYSSSS
jgi:hypothetical protein